MKNINRILTLILIIALALSASACFKSGRTLTKEIYALDTVITLTVNNCSSETLDSLEGEIRWLEDIFSRSVETSDINRLNDNSGGFVEVSSHTFDVLKTASEVSENTNGAFDVTVAPAISLWGFDSGNYRVPENDTLSNILDFIDYKKIMPYNIFINQNI